MFEKIVIIGNGVVDKELGHIIDKFDIVVRFKYFVTEGHEKYIGSKTDVIAWNIGHLAKEDMGFCRRQLKGNKNGGILAYQPHKRRGRTRWLTKRRVYFIKKYEKEYNFKFISMKDMIKIADMYSKLYDNYKKYHMSTGLFFILYFLHFKQPIYITGFDFFQTGHQSDKEWVHSEAHSPEREKKIVHDLIKDRKIIML